ncbi:MAG: hypothetical protein MSC31_06570 [Solirubrobacteraceae bacterium MAG38_C4-C5]|nr:hypothetical protein [Candidatus Siliceabacter maunaloa]
MLLDTHEVARSHEGARAAGWIADHAWVVTALLCAGWIAAGWRTPDLAAQAFRADLFEREGFALWNNAWYGGHHTVGYSLLFPPLAWMTGIWMLGALSAVAATALFQRLAGAHLPPAGARAGALLVSLASVADLVIGRLTYALGAAIALAAVLALDRRRPVLAAALAVATTAASPVAGLFVAMAGVSIALASARRGRARDEGVKGRWRDEGMEERRPGEGVKARRRDDDVKARRRDDDAEGGRRAPPAWHGLALAAGAFIPAVALAVAFPAGGRQPFWTVGFLVTLAAAFTVLALLPRGWRTVRTGATVYAVAVVAALLVDSPMGSNVSRLGVTFAAALLACALPFLAGRRTALATAAILAFTVWTLWGPVREVAKVVDDPSTAAAYSAPLIDAVRARTQAPVRVEVPFTRAHWVENHVAQQLPLARGWMTQIDTRRNALFRDGTPLTADEYRAWLHDSGVAFVALPDVPLDPTGRREAELVESGGAPYLDEVWRDEDWRLFAVDGSPGLATGAATVTALEPQAVTLDAQRPGETLLRVRPSPYWRVTRGEATIAPAGDWLSVRAARPGTIRLEARLIPAGKLRDRP